MYCIYLLVHILFILYMSYAISVCLYGRLQHMVNLHMMPTKVCNVNKRKEERKNNCCIKFCLMEGRTL